MGFVHSNVISDVFSQVIDDTATRQCAMMQLLLDRLGHSKDFADLM